jgi:hypothetical protein
MAGFTDKTTAAGAGAMSVAAQIIRERSILYDLRSQQKGRAVYFILRINPQKQKAFKEAFDEGRTVDLHEFGDVIHSGTGEPSEALKAELREKYGLYEK